MEHKELIVRFIEGWKHFCDCIDFDKSAMDADAMKFMNEMPAQIIKALKENDKRRN